MYGYYDPYYQYAPEIVVSSEEDTAGNTEDLEPESENEIVSNSGLQAIRSVSNIHNVYDNENDQLSPVASSNDVPQPESRPPLSSSSSEEEESDDEEDDVETTTDADEHVPHQLSVIFEESDAIMSDAPDRRREASVVSEDDSSTTIAVDSGDEEETVTVRLPLRLKFSKSENDEDVTTVIVGDSLVDKCNSVSVTVNIRSRPNSTVPEEDNAGDSSSEESSSEDEVASTSATVTLSKTEDSGRVSVKELIKAIEDCQDSEEEDEEEDDEEEEAEEVEEEEADSGVTSQTDTESECFNEIRRNKYQRAATHSRLFKLLHDQCQAEDDEEDDKGEEDNPISIALTLPLSTCSRSSVPDSYSSSGIASPASTPPRRRNANSDQSTPNEVWTDYLSYYNSWDGGGGGGGGRKTPVSPFPKQPPRCPMTPAPSEGSGVRGSGGFSAS